MLQHFELSAKETRLQENIAGAKAWQAWQELIRRGHFRLVNRDGEEENPRWQSVEEGVFDNCRIEIAGERYMFGEGGKTLVLRGESWLLMEAARSTGLTAEELRQALSLNGYGFDSDELKGKNFLRSAQLIERNCGPWVLQRRRAADGSEAQAVLLRFDEARGIYAAVEDEELVRWIAELAALDVRDKRRIVENLRGLDLPTVDQRQMGGWLFLANGDLCLETGELHTASPERVCAFRADTVFDPGAESALADRFLGWYEPDDLKGIFRMFACTLFEGQPRQCFFYVFGAPGGGKSTLLELLMEAVYGKGQNVAVFDPALDLDSGKNAFGLEGLDSAAVLYNPDMGENFIGDSGVLKAIVGGSPITINEKHKAKYTCTLGGKVILVSNSAPRFQDTSGAIKDRAVVFHLAKGGLRGSAEEIRLDAISAEEKQKLKQVLLRKVLEEYRWLANHPEAGKEEAFPRSAKSWAALKGFDERESGLNVLRGLGSAIIGLSPKAFMECFDDAWAASPYAGNTKGRPQYDNLKAKLEHRKVAGVPIIEWGFNLRLKCCGREVLDRRNLAALVPDPEYLAERLAGRFREREFTETLFRWAFLRRWLNSRGAELPLHGFFGQEKEKTPACPFFTKMLPEDKRREIQAWVAAKAPEFDAAWHAVLGLLENGSEEDTVLDDVGLPTFRDWEAVARGKDLEIAKLKRRIAELEELLETAKVA